MRGSEAHAVISLPTAKVTSIGHMGSAEAIDAALASEMLDGAIQTWYRLEALLAEG